MIEIFCDSERCSINISGHAKYNQLGKDIVCAGVSELVFAYAQAVEKMADNRKIVGKRIIINEKPAVISVEPDGFSEGLSACFDMVIGGLRLIASKYPENIRITYF